MSFRSRFFATALLGLAAIPLASGASAKDLATLARLLIPAYVAQDLANLCASQDSNFLSELKYGSPSIGTFAEHVKREVTVDMPEDEAAKIRITAADTAQQIARHELYAVIEKQTDDPARPLKRWCTRSVKPFIFEILIMHQEKHLVFDKIVANAKR
ncbi:MAG TPA: hypothetical protein VFB31_14960 [Pseudolabrys sp.]|nr:hypothetical protein [Pseudolabrys sp.]